MWTKQEKMTHFWKQFKDGWDKVGERDKVLKAVNENSSVTSEDGYENYMLYPFPFGKSIPDLERMTNRLGFINPWQEGGGEEVRHRAKAPKREKGAPKRATSRQKKRRSGVATRTSPRTRRRSLRLATK